MLDMKRREFIMLLGGAGGLAAVGAGAAARAGPAHRRAYASGRGRSGRTGPHWARCVYRKSDSAILVMKTAEDRSRCDDSEALNRARERGIFAQRAMNSRLVVISSVGI
jgi:hypothetical protein